MGTIATVKLLVVSGDSAVLRPLWSMAESNCWRLEITASPWEGMERVQSGVTFNLLLLDLLQGEAEDLHTLRWFRRLRPSLPIILIGDPGDREKQEESIRLGASGYLVRPVEQLQLEAMIQRNLPTAVEAAGMELTSEDVEAIGDGHFFIGLSPIMQRLRAQAALLAESDVPVLILGENGSGKETTARLVHRLSVRSAFEFAKVKCAALPGDLLERELFGYERTSATAPTRTKTGKLELCAKGTILLDEITEMPLGLQANLVRVFQNRYFIRPGTSTLIESDVRLLATSSTNMERAVSENRFDEKLYRYLTPYTIHVPPLRERRSEISLLARHFMHQLTRRYGMPARDLSSGIVEAWQAYNWPGNLAELEQFVKRFLVLGDNEFRIDNDSMSSGSKPPDSAMASLRARDQLTPSFTSGGAPGPDSKSLRSLVQSVKSEAERSAIAAALEKTGWNRKAAARILKVSYRTVLYKIEQYKMTSLKSPMYSGGNGGGNGNGNGHTATGGPGANLRG